MNTDLIYKLLKYLSHGTVIYLLFKFVPKQPMADQDILLITIIVILLYAIIENACAIFWTSDNNNSTTSQLLTLGQCNTKCASKPDPKTEHMDNLSSLLPSSLLSQPSNPLPQQPAAIPEPVKAEVKSEVKPAESKVEPNAIKPDGEGGYKIGMPVNPQVTAVGSRAQDGELNNEMGYTDYSDGAAGDYVDYNNFPQHDLANAEFESGYSFLPPSQWYPVPPHPPVCVSEKRCPVCPVFTTGLPADLKEWNASRRIMPPDRINVKYVEEKLNSGR